MTKPIVNPVLWSQIQGDMSTAEQHFAGCLSQGVPCMLGDVVPETADDSNTVRPEVIRFFAYGGDGDHPIRGTNIFLQGAWIPGPSPLDLMSAQIPYFLGMHKCLLESNLLMLNAECVGLSMHGSRLRGTLNADSAKISGNILLRQGFTAEKGVLLLGARISGSLDCEGGKFFANPDGMAIVADGAVIDGNVHLRKGFSAEGQVRLAVARIGGGLDCSDGSFNNPGKDALSADGLNARSRIVMKKASIVGKTRLTGGRTDGPLECDGCSFRAPNGVAFHANGIVAKGGIALRNGFFAEGEVRLLGARTDGNLDCGSGTFHNPGGKALSADRIFVGGTVFLSGRFSAKGEVRLLSARIGDLACEGKFENLESVALGATDMEVGGDAMLRAFYQGEVRLIGSRIGRTLSVTGIFNNEREVALNAERVSAQDGILWIPESGEGVVNFNFAKTAALVDRIEKWKPFKVVLDGFVYDQFVNPMDAKSRLEWLANRPEEIRLENGGEMKVPFSPLPYERAAKVMHTMGRPVDAWDILREKRRLERKRDKAGWLQRAWGRTIDTLTDFVYRPLRTVKWTAGVVLAGALAFGAADDRERMVPHQPIVLAKAEYQNAREAGKHPSVAARAAVPDYPGFNPLVFSLDVFVPLFNLHQEPYWAPDPGGGDLARWRFWREGKFDWWWLLTAWYWIEIMAGWLLTSLLLLSVTGLLRPRIGGGD